MATEKSQNKGHIWDKSTVDTVKVKAYVNGNKYFPGKDFFFNKNKPPTFDVWMDLLTSKLDFRVRRLFTPGNGTRVKDIESMSNGDLIVAGAKEPFQRIRYEEIPQKRKHHRVSYDLPPGSKKRYQVSGRHRKVNVQGMIIRCWRNGRTNQGAKPVNIRPVRDDSLEKVMRLVSDTLRERLETLYTHPDGVEVTSMEQIASHGMYVAAKNRSESFQSLTYTELAPANISNYVHHSPSPERRHGSLPQLRSNKTSSQSSPEHSVSSNNGYRRERAKREEDGVFHARPVKHKRSSEKVRQTDYDQDNRGVFKAKSQNQATLGARQVDESRQTKTDVPVDQRQAEEVKEDVKGKDKKDKKGKKTGKKTRSTYSTRQDLKAEREEEEDGDDGGELSSPRRPDQQRTYRSNARRPDSPGNEQARREAERKAQEKRAAEDRERAEKARKEQEAMRRKKEDKDKKKNGKKAEEQKEAQKRRQQEEERRKEEERNAAEERRRREEEEEKRKKAAGASSPKHHADKGNRTPSPQRRGESPYRSGTELVREEDRRNNRHNDNDNWDDRTPTPGKETSRGGRGGDSRASQNRHGGRREEEEQGWGREEDNWGPGAAEEELKAMGEEERERAAVTIQSHYRGFRARQQTAAMRAGLEG